MTSHYATQLCIECGSPDLYAGGEIKEPKMCFACFASMAGFTTVDGHLIDSDDLEEIKAGHRIDITDHCTDIANHISPTTVVIER